MAGHGNTTKTIGINILASSSIVLDPNYFLGLKCLIVKDDDIYHNIRAQAHISDVTIPYDYNASSSPHEELLLDKDNIISICDSVDTVSSSQPYQFTLYITRNGNNDL